MANDSETELLIRAKNVTEQAFKEVSAALKALGDQQRKVTDDGKAQWTALNEKLSGSQAIAGANALTKAIGDIGGASKLTASEQARVNATITEALAKYRALGQEAPEALRALANATKSAGDKSSLLSSTFSQVLSAVSAAGLISKAGSYLTSLGSGALEAAGALVDMSNKTGLSTETLQRMQFVAKQSGTDVETFANAAFKLGVNVSDGTAKARAGAESLGLSWTALRAASPDDQFNMVVRALEAMADPQQRNAAAVALFGKTAQEVLPAIVDGYSKVAREAQLAGDAQVHALDGAGDALDRFKHRVQVEFTQAAGNVILLKEAMNGLTEDQKVFVRQTDASIHSIEDLQAAMIRAWQARQKMGKDVNLAAPKPLPPSFTEQLRQAASGYAALNAAQRSQIDAALQMGKSNDDIINGLNITEGVLSLAKKAYEDHKSAVSKAAEEAKKYADVLDRVHGAVVPLALVEQERVRTLEALKVSTADIAAYLHVTEAAVSTYTASLKEQSKEVADIGKQINNLPHNVPLRLQPRDLSGPAPLVKGGTQLDPNRIDWKAIAENSNMYLTSMAQKAQATYEYMTAHSSEFSEATIRHFKKIADDAQHAADGTKSVWDRTFSAMGDVATILDNLPGKFTQIGAVAARTGQAIMKNLADGNIWGAVVAGATGAIEAFKKLFVAASAGRDAVKKFADEQGGFDALHAKLNVLGAEGERLWISLTQGVGKNDPAAAKVAIDTITKALDDQKQATDSLLQSQNQQLGDLASQLQGLGAGQLLQPYLDQLAQAKGLTSDNLALLTRLGGDGSVSFDQMQKAAQALGVSTDSLGQSFQAAKSKADWQSIIDNMDTLQHGGSNLNDLLGDAGLQKKLDDLVISSIKFGTEIPANAKPWVEQLIQQGKLLDANGDKITDTSKLKFGGDLTTSMQALVDKVGELIDKLSNGLPDAVRKIPPKVTTEFEFHGKKTGEWPDEDPSNPGAPTADGGPTASHADGAYIRQDHVAHVHAGEIIGPESFMTRALEGALARTGLGAGAEFAVAPIVLDGQKLADILVRRIPASVQRFNRR